MRILDPANDFPIWAVKLRSFLYAYFSAKSRFLPFPKSRRSRRDLSSPLCDQIKDGPLSPHREDVFHDEDRVHLRREAHPVRLFGAPPDCSPTTRRARRSGSPRAVDPSIVDTVCVGTQQTV